MTERAPGPFTVWFLASRPRTLPAAVAPVMVASALAWHDGRFHLGPASVCLAFSLLVQIGTNFANDYFDFIQGADTAARVGPKRAVASGWVSSATMRRVMVGTFTAAFLVGLLLLHWGGLWLLGVGVASILAGVCYTGGPYPLGYHGLGDLFVFLFFGLVAVVTTYVVQAQHLSAAAVAAAVPIGLLAANILVVNNYRDADTDREAGKRTLVVRFGRGYARWQFGLSLVVSFAVPVAFAARGYGLPVLAPLLLIPLALAHARRLRTEASAPDLIALLGDTGKLLALFALLFSAGLVL